MEPSNCILVSMYATAQPRLLIHCARCTGCWPRLGVGEVMKHTASCHDRVDTSVFWKGEYLAQWLSPACDTHTSRTGVPGFKPGSAAGFSVLLMDIVAGSR